MRLLRFVGLLATLAAAYCASYIFEHRTLIGFLPPWALAWSPALYSLSRWLPADLMVLAGWLSAGAAIGFGLLASTWQGHAVAPIQSTRIARSRRLGQGAMALALLMSAATALYLAWMGETNGFAQVLWALALPVFLLGAALAARPRAVRRPVDNVHVVAPERHWRSLLLLLMGLAGALIWRTFFMATAIDEQMAQWGLQAQMLAGGGDGRLFATSISPSLPPLATATLALMLRVQDDVAVGIALCGLLSALLTVVAVWLVGCELFRRKAILGAYGETLEDSGAWVALLAAGLVGTSTLFLHFGGLPVYLEPVAWGTLGLWALLRGLRIGDGLAVALSGVLIGWAALLYPSGLGFMLVAPCWWIGVWLLQPGWLRPAGRGLALTWIGALATVIAPQAAIWLRDPTAFLAQFPGALLPSALELLTVLGLHPAAAQASGYPAIAFSPVVAVIAILAVGNLLLNLDRLAGWALFTWSLVALIVGNVLADTGGYWPTLLPMLPVLALAIAFTVDRIRRTLLESAGTWTAQAATYLAIGLVVWSALWSWVEYHHFVQANHDAAGQTAMLIHALPADRIPVLVVGSSADAVTWQRPALRLLNGQRLVDATEQTLRADNWPATLPVQSTVFVQPADATLLGEIQTRYPGGAIVIPRDLHGNPIAYVYSLP